MSIRPNRSMVSIIFLSIFAACSFASLFGQGTSSSTNGVPVFKVNARSVIVDVAVTDRHGNTAGAR